MTVLDVHGLIHVEVNQSGITQFAEFWCSVLQLAQTDQCMCDVTTCSAHIWELLIESQLRRVYVV